MDRLLEATYGVEQRRFWWTGLRAFVGPLAAEATRGLTAAQASITSIPFAAATFDLVTALDVLYSLSEAEEAAALAEIHRILKPGGTLIVNVAALPILRGNPFHLRR